MRCPNCNGLNPDDSEWCGQCFVRFEQQKANLFSELKTAVDGVERGRRPVSTVEGSPPAPAPAPPSPPSAPARAQPPAPPAASPAPEKREPDRTRDLAELQEAPVIYDRGFLRQRRKLVGWQCGNCGRRNTMETNVCVDCGATLFASFDLAMARVRAEEKMEQAPETADLAPTASLNLKKEPERTKRNPVVAAALSVIPGAGQLFIGRIPDGLARLLITAWWFPAGIFMLSTAPVAWLGILFLASAVGLAIISAADAYRNARHPAAEPILTKQILLYANVGLISLAAIGGMLAIFTIRR
jgi:TM2 domain-containing membrane protein YozV